MNALCPGDCCSPLRLSGAIDALTDPSRTIIERDVILDLLDPRAIDGTDYPCRKFDPITRLCTIYDQRPQMCSEYPYGRSCELCDASEVTEGEPISRYVPAEYTGIFAVEDVIWETV